MRKHYILFFLTLLFLGSCIGGVPNGIIKPDKMINLMVDVHIVDGSLYNIDTSTPDSVYKYGIDRYLKVFKQHSTDSVQFKKSLEYYSLHPDQLEEIYTEVSKVLQAKNDSLNKILIKAPTKKGPKQNALPQK